MPRWSFDADGSPVLQPQYQPRMRLSGRLSGGRNTRLSPPPEGNHSPPAAAVSPGIPVMSVACTPAVPITETIVYPDDMYDGTVLNEAYLVEEQAYSDELFSSMHENKVLKRELEAQGKVLTCAIDRHKKISTKRTEQFQFLKKKVGLAMRLGQCRALCRKYYEKLQRWTHHSLWMREACPNRRSRSAPKGRRSIIPPPRKPSSIFPENDVSQDQLRRELVAARAKISSLKEMCSVMEKTVVETSRRNDELQVRIEEEATNTPVSLKVEEEVASIPATPPDARRYNKSLEETLTAVDITSVQKTCDRLYNALKGFGTDEQTIFNELSTITSQADWHAVNRTFRRQHPDIKEGSLRQALASDLTQRELNHCKDILKDRGVMYEAELKRAERVAPKRNVSPKKKTKPRTEVVFGRVVVKKPAAKKSLTNTSEKTTWKRPAENTVEEPKLSPTMSSDRSKAALSILKPTSPMPFLPPAEVAKTSNDLRVERSPSVTQSKIVSPGAVPRRASKSSAPTSPKTPKRTAPPATVVEYYDSDGDLLVFTLKYEGIIYSVNGEERPPTRCIMVAEDLSKLDFPDINKAVELPDFMER